MMLKTLSYLAFFVFLSFAAMQLNDPDPYVWIPVYLLPAVFCLLTATGSLLNRRMRVILLILTLSYSFWAMIIFPYGANTFIDNEEFRESGGLLISAIAFILMYFSALKKKQSRASRPL